MAVNVYSANFFVLEKWVGHIQSTNILRKTTNFEGETVKRLIVFTNLRTMCIRENGLLVTWAHNATKFNPHTDAKLL